MADQEQITIRVLPSLSEISREDWDACAGGGTGKKPGNPFLRYDFLKALEDTDCATGQTGWQAQHLVVEDAAGTPMAIMPLYLKDHSQGEYVFDHGWADALMRAGVNYYPKLQSSIPFTPVTGPRLLTREPDRMDLQAALLQATTTLADRLDCSSVHITFMPEDQSLLANQLEFHTRTDRQFHWFNDDFADFDAFLATLTSRKRKNLKKERRKALESGLEIHWVVGENITEEHWDAFFTFYQDTGARKWGTPYLTRAFFSEISKTMADDILLMFAYRNGNPIAGALNFIGEDTLYGRYWGCTEHHPFLHFELCYMQAIDFAIQRGLKKVEAGAQGEHKIARGYLPVTTYSAHWFAIPGMHKAVGDYLEEEQDYVAREHEILTEHSPFKKEPSDD